MQQQQDRRLPGQIEGLGQNTCRSILSLGSDILPSTGIIDSSVAGGSQIVGVSNRSKLADHHCITRLLHLITIPSQLRTPLVAGGSSVNDHR